MPCPARRRLRRGDRRRYGYAADEALEQPLDILVPEADCAEARAHPWPVRDIVLQHHERLDGSGYPFGLGGEAIGRGARILAVADVVEAIASHRPYRPALGLEPALEEIRAGAGTLYDPAVVEACLAVVGEEGLVLA